MKVLDIVSIIPKGHVDKTGVLYCYNGAKWKKGLFIIIKEVVVENKKLFQLVPLHKVEQTVKPLLDLFSENELKLRITHKDLAITVTQMSKKIKEHIHASNEEDSGNLEEAIRIQMSGIDAILGKYQFYSYQAIYERFKTLPSNFEVFVNNKSCDFKLHLWNDQYKYPAIRLSEKEPITIGQALTNFIESKDDFEMKDLYCYSECMINVSDVGSSSDELIYDYVVDYENEYIRFITMKYARTIVLEQLKF